METWVLSKIVGVNPKLSEEGLWEGVRTYEMNCREKVIKINHRSNSDIHFSNAQIDLEVPREAKHLP